MVGVAQRNDAKDTVDLYDKLPNIKSCVNQVGNQIWMGKKTAKNSSAIKALVQNDILATTIDFDAKTVTWFNETKNTTISIDFPDLSSGGDWHFSVLFYTAA